MKTFLSIRHLLSATICGAGVFIFVIAAHSQTSGVKTMKISLNSPAFTEGQPIPPECACDDKNLSPALQWKDLPAGAKSLALICDDPDAPSGTWVHWVLYDLPASTAGLAENVPKSPELSNGAKQGVNDFKQIGYSGPCPPPGKAHRYYFNLYALDQTLGLKSGATKDDVLKAMNGHVLAEGELMGTFRR